jgi:hypothetical protein
MLLTVPLESRPSIVIKVYVCRFCEAAEAASTASYLTCKEERLRLDASSPSGRLKVTVSFGLLAFVMLSGAVELLLRRKFVNVPVAVAITVTF